MVMTEICQYLRNWFKRAQFFGKFKIENGNLVTQYDTGLAVDVIPVLDGQYFRVIGSALNDGVYKYSPTGQSLQDETWEGAVWLMGVPKAIEDLAGEIDAWQQKYNNSDSAMLSPFNSESFGGYSYSKGNGNNNSGSDGGTSWKTVFASRLAQWRKI